MDNKGFCGEFGLSSVSKSGSPSARFLAASYFSDCAAPAYSFKTSASCFEYSHTLFFAIAPLTVTTGRTVPAWGDFIFKSVMKEESAALA